MLLAQSDLPCRIAVKLGRYAWCDVAAWGNGRTMGWNFDVASSNFQTRIMASWQPQNSMPLAAARARASPCISRRAGSAADVLALACIPAAGILNSAQAGQLKHCTAAWQTTSIGSR